MKKLVDAAVDPRRVASDRLDADLRALAWEQAWDQQHPLIRSRAVTQHGQALAAIVDPGRLDLEERSYFWISVHVHDH